MRALITGGAGFIGSHLADALLERGDDVAVIDDLSTGRMENIQHLKPRPRFSYTIDTIQNRAVMAELVDNADVVFHLAAAVGVRLIIESPVQTIETNVKGTELVLEVAAKKRKTVIVASTSEVYGKANILPFSEDNDIVLGPTSNARFNKSDWVDANFFIDCTNFLFGVASGVAFPVTLLPGVFQAIAVLLPTTYAMDILRREAIGARPTFDPALEYVALIGTTAVLYPVGRSFFRRAERIMRVRGSVSQF